MPIKYPINLHKGLTAFVVFGMMCWFDNLSIGAWVYLALHGSYGFLWLFKDRTYPDKKWEEIVSIPYAILVFVALGLYWIAPFILISMDKAPGNIMISAAIALNLFGMVLHFGSDAQKYFTLRQKPGLITNGFFARCRNPNYLGELMIYLGFAMLSMHWMGYIGITLFFLFVFIPGMLRKDKSLSRYPNFEDYKKRTGLLFPKLFN
jgi:steroid 5-alpha reductase family enzyme